jgi:tRNA(adenine34) deaminase
MEFALKEAQRALDEDEVPVGAVIVWENKVIGRGHNQIERLQDPTAHAEMIAITAAAAHLNSRRLENCTLYVTLEPCPMCAGAIVLARIPILVFGAFDPKAGACSTLYNIVNDGKLNHRVEMVTGILGERCSDILKQFFVRLRANADPHASARSNEQEKRANPPGLG